MQRSLVLAFLFLAASTSTALAQVAESWTFTRGDLFFTSYELTGGRTDAAGQTTAFGRQNTQFPSSAPWIVRLDPSGGVVWEASGSQNLGGTGGYVASFPAGADEIACGWLGVGPFGPTPVMYAMVVDRIDASGQRTTLAQFGDFSVSHRANAATVDASGDVWLAGTSGTFGPRSMRIVRYASNGMLEMTGTWDGGPGGSASGTQIALDSTGGARVVGQNENGSGVGIGIVRFDSVGAFVWSQTHGTGGSVPRAIAVGASGECYIAGSLHDPVQGNQFALLRYEADGTFAWERIVSEPAHAMGVAESVALDPSGDVIVAGTWTNGVGKDRHVVVRKYSPTGSLSWSSTWSAGTVVGSAATNVHVDGGGNVYVVGSTTLLVSGPTQPFALAFDRDGNERWTHSFSASNGINTGVAATTGPIGSVYVLAQVTPNSSRSARVTRLDETAVPTCFGDGSTTACPCGNASPSSERAGCVNSFGAAGRLVANGSSSLAADTLVLVGEGMTNASALYIQGDGGGTPVVFGDGLRCVGANVVRLGPRTNAGGASSWPGVGDPTVSVRGGVVTPGQRTYQVWYRNTAPFCTADGFNLTNGVIVTWGM